MKCLPGAGKILCILNSLTFMCIYYATAFLMSFVLGLNLLKFLSSDKITQALPLQSWCSTFKQSLAH